MYQLLPSDLNLKSPTSPLKNRSRMEQGGPLLVVSRDITCYNIYNPYKWPYKWVNLVISYNPTYRGPMSLHLQLVLGPTLKNPPQVNG